jgi:DNA-binding MarR family transcriptional regulator
MRDIARYLMITPPGATLLIDGLVRAKLLTRVGDEQDRRIVRIAITPSGTKMIMWGKKEKTAMLHKTFSVLNQDERNMLIATLEKVVVKKLS